MPADLSTYGPGWKEFSRRIRFEVAGGRCQCEGECGLHRTTPGPRRCEERHGEPAKWAKGKIVLTVAHLNHADGPCRCEPPCRTPEHVKAMCNRCHLRLDVGLHVRNAAARRRRERTVREPELPLGGEARG